MGTSGTGPTASQIILARHEWPPGERFPGTVALAAEYGVAQATTQKAVVALGQSAFDAASAPSAAAWCRQNS
ncbi:hypothetical protein ACFYWN_45025 [Streptomyces sp. NPDC002917]|uniref:hypothetical protein n=1 Tax=Streptomyces sp. NPDC002917 TaxID=3364671 RepID=UPI0036C10544